MVIALVDMPALAQVGSKDVCIFVNGAVLYNGSFAFADLAHLVKAAVEKIDLQVKRPARHVVIKIT